MLIKFAPDWKEKNLFVNKKILNLFVEYNTVSK